MVTRLFFDCEFTDLTDSASLISAGFITHSGDPFYVELSDYAVEACNDFVKATVLPLLSLPPRFNGGLPCLPERLASLPGR